MANLLNRACFFLRDWPGLSSATHEYVSQAYQILDFSWGADDETAADVDASSYYFQSDYR